MTLQESSDSSDEFGSSDDDGSSDSDDEQRSQSEDSYDQSDDSANDPCIPKKLKHKKVRGDSEKEHRKWQVYCCYCAGKHAEDDCNNKHMLRQNRMQHMRE